MRLNVDCYRRILGEKRLSDVDVMKSTGLSGMELTEEQREKRAETMRENMAKRRL